MSMENCTKSYINEKYVYVTMCFCPMVCTKHYYSRRLGKCLEIS